MTRPDCFGMVQWPEANSHGHVRRNPSKKVAQQAGQFEFITGQLRDVLLYMHARFNDFDGRFTAVEGRLDKIEGRLDTIDIRLDTLEGKIDALPRVIAVLMAGG